jgi:hypothetical protein
MKESRYALKGEVHSVLSTVVLAKHFFFPQ